MLAITDAAAALGQTPRMLRYRESLGLLTPGRSAAGHRAYGDGDLLAARLAIHLEEQHRVPPVALSFALRALEDPELTSRLHLLARLARRREAAAIDALDFDQQKAQRLLRPAA